MSTYPERHRGHLTGKWIAEVTDRGERRRKRFDSKRDAERWADYIKLTGSAPPETMEAAVNTVPLFKEVALEAKAANPAWQRGRDRSALNRFCFVVDFFVKDRVDALTTLRLDEFVRNLKRRPCRGGKVSPATINRYLSVISMIFTYAKSRKVLAAVPDMPWQEEPKKRMHWLTDGVEQVVRAFLLESGEAHCELAVRVLAASGMRWGEYAVVDTRGVVMPEAADQPAWVKLDQTKTDTPRDIPIPADLAAEYRAQIAAKARPTYNTMRNLMKKALEKAGQSSERPVHCLRHSTATRLILQNVNVAVVQNFLGHRDIKTTLKYVHVTSAALADASKKLSQTAGQTTKTGTAAATSETAETPAAQGQLTDAAE